MINYKDICDSVIAISKEAGNFLMTEIEKIKVADIKNKGVRDFVTYVDVNAEKMIVEALKKILPEAGFITEEGVETHRAEKYNWIIDPLDGTTNFVNKVPIYCTSIALMEDSEIVVGVIYEPNSDECFYAYKNSKSYLNGEVITVHDKPELISSLFATGFPYQEYEKMDEYVKVFKYFLSNSSGVRRLGSAAVDIAYTACGRFQGFYEFGLKPWDVAAGVIIIKQAGGVVSDFKNGNNYLFGAEIVAAAPTAHKETIKALELFGL